MGQAARANRQSQLQDVERRVLMFERQHWCYEGSKETAIRDLFDMEPTRYYELLTRLIDTDEALAFDPQLVKRLRRQRLERHRARSARRLDPPSPDGSPTRLGDRE
ncbi:MAG: DUF3263 domain-containing protein [Bifidobacteriaceae bacterium]|jgi:hypothetical protein|nr:DUF3263 domain-containing protein [Bifidobacteriaceae bacterium]